MIPWPPPAGLASAPHGSSAAPPELRLRADAATGDAAPRRRTEGVNLGALERPSPSLLSPRQTLTGPSSRSPARAVGARGPLATVTAPQTGHSRPPSGGLPSSTPGQPQARAVEAGQQAPVGHSGGGGATHGGAAAATTRSSGEGVGVPAAGAAPPLDTAAPVRHSDAGSTCRRVMPWSGGLRRAPQAVPPLGPSTDSGLSTAGDALPSTWGGPRTSGPRATSVDSGGKRPREGSQRPGKCSAGCRQLVPVPVTGAAVGLRRQLQCPGRFTPAFPTPVLSAPLLFPWPGPS